MDHSTPPDVREVEQTLLDLDVSLALVRSALHRGELDMARQKLDAVEFWAQHAKNAITRVELALAEYQL